jgi:hypothetical protein
MLKKIFTSLIDKLSTDILPGMNIEITKANRKANG